MPAQPTIWYAVLINMPISRTEPFPTHFRFRSLLWRSLGICQASENLAKELERIALEMLVHLYEIVPGLGDEREVMLDFQLRQQFVELLAAGLLRIIRPGPNADAHPSANCLSLFLGQSPRHVRSAIV